MADVTALKNRIKSVIKQNNNQEITGSILQNALLDIIDELNEGTGDETTRAQDAESALGQRITEEKTRAEQAESDLQTAIDTEQERAEAAEQVNADAISAEKTRAEGAENALSSRILANAQAIQFEKARAEGIEDELSRSISSEEQRAKSAELTLQNNINAEQARAEQALQTAINTEQVRAEQAENQLRNLIDDFTNRGFIYKGIAPLTAPTTENKTFYIAKPGDYTGYTGIGNGSFTFSGISVFAYDTASASGGWTKNDIVLFDDEPTGGSRNIVSSNGVFGIIEDISNPVESYLIENYALLENGTFDTSTSYKHAAIPVVSGEKYIVRNIGTATSVQSYTRYAFVTSKDSTAGGDIPFVAGTGIVIVPHKGAVVATIPEGCKYLLVNISINTSGSYPFSVSKVMTGDKLKSDIEQSSMCFSLNGDNSNLVSIDLHKFNFGATYRLYIGNTDIDMSTVTYSTAYLRLFAAIYNENKERVGDLLVEVYIGTFLNNYYDFTIPSSIIEADNIINPQTCTLTVGMRASRREVQDFRIVDLSDAHSIDDTPTYNSKSLITSGGVYNTIGIYKKSYKDIDPTEYRYTILTNDTWGISSGYSHFRIPVIEGERFVIINKGTESTYRVRYCLAKSLERGENNEIDLVSGTHVESLELYKSVVIDIPETCNYLILHNNSNIDCYKFANISDVVNEGNDEFESVHTERLQYVDNEIQGNNIVAPPVLDSNGWEIPQTKQMNILIKKVRQLANIRWTPKLATIPITGTGVTPSHYGISEKIGIPYSGNGARTVGMGVSLETFMTAINNKYSLMYTEDLLEETSVWGSGVPHFPTNNHSRSYYGTYCNGFVAYVHGCDVPVYCGRFGFVSAMYHTFSPVFNPFDKDSFRQGDILTTGPNSSSTHSRLVYNVQRNSDGEVVSIQIAESSGSNGSGDSKGLVRIHEPKSGSILDDYLQSMKNAGYEHYRNIQLYKNVDYDISPFILLDNEESDDYVYNNDVCTFAGNKATFLVGQTVVINYNLSDDANWNYSHLRLYKDDTLIHTQAIEQIDSSDYPTSPIMQAGHAWKIDTALLNSAGIYKVCAYDGTNESSFTYFEVVTDNCTIEKIKDDVYDISFNGNEDVRGLILTGGSGGNYTWILLSEDEKELKKVRIYPKRTFNKFNMKFSQFNVAWYIQGHYGLIRSSVISIE